MHCGGEVIDSITVLASILVIIVIHSILKSLSEGLENKGIAQITYYVQYILIVTLIMTNFVQILDIVKDSIQSLVGFMNSLIPILITLMITTGSIVSANLIQLPTDYWCSPLINPVSAVNTSCFPACLFPLIQE